MLSINSIVVVLFVDAANQSFKNQEHDHHHHNADTENLLKVKIFRAQRNMYLTGAVIFLSLVLNRFYRLIVDLAQNEEKMEILKQQAAKTTKEYLVQDFDRNYWIKTQIQRKIQEFNNWNGIWPKLKSKQLKPMRNL